MRLCFLSILAFAAVTSAKTEFKIDPDRRVLHIAVNQGIVDQVLTCILNNSPDKATLKWTVPMHATAYINDVVHKDQTDKVNPDGTYNIRKELLLKDYSNRLDGDYKCSYDVGSSEKSTTIKLEEIDVERSDETYYFGNKTVTLFCRIINKYPPTADLEYVWRKDNADLEEGEKYSMNKETGELTISKLDRDDAGVYDVVHSLTQSGTTENSSCLLEYRAGPLVLDMEKSINSKEEEEVNIDCEVKGWPKATVTWHFGEKLLNVTSRISFKPHEGFENARLVIRGLKFSDEGDYTCRAHSAYFKETAEKSIKLRVKDKLGWLYPLITILVEVVVLVFLVFLFDKLKKKDD